MMDNLKRARTRANSRFSVLVIGVFLTIVIMVNIMVNVKITFS